MLSCHISFFARWYIKVKVRPFNPNVSHTPRKPMSGGRHSPGKSEQTLCYLQMRISSQYWKYPSPNCKFGKLAPRLLTPFTSTLWTLSQVSVNASSSTPISCCFPQSFLLPFCLLNMFAPKWKQLPESIHPAVPEWGGFLSPAVLHCDWGLFDAFPSLLGHHIAFWAFQQLLCFCTSIFQLFEVLWSIFLHHIPRVPQSKPWAFSPGQKKKKKSLHVSFAIWCFVCVCGYIWIHTWTYMDSYCNW